MSSGSNLSSELLYVAVPVETTAIIQGMGIRGGATLADSKSMALQIACTALFLPTDATQIELALFSVTRTELDVASFVEDSTEEAGDSGRYHYRMDIPAVALKLVEFYLISDEEARGDENEDRASDEDDIDLDVYGDFAKYF